MFIHVKILWEKNNKKREFVTCIANWVLSQVEYWIKDYELLKLSLEKKSKGKLADENLIKIL